MKSNTRFKDNKKGYECLNCKQPLDSRDNFCSNCGQVNDLKPLSIKQYLKEFLSGFFAFDTRTLNTLAPLLFKPGKVALEYIKGERMKYVNPFQLYLHTSIVFFLLLNLMLTYDKYDTIIKDYEKKKANPVAEKQQKEKKEINIGVVTFSYSSKLNDSTKIIVTNNDVIKRITNKVDVALKDSIIAVLNNNSLEKLQKQIRIDSLITKSLKNITLNDSIKTPFQVHKLAFDSLVKRLNHLPKSKLELLAKSKQDLVDATKLSLTDKTQLSKKAKTKDVAKALDSMGLPLTRTNIYWFQKTKSIDALKDDNSDFNMGLSPKFISKISLTMFFMLPLFTLFVWLYYYKRGMTYTEHLIFVFNVQTVAFIVILFLIPLQQVISSKFLIAFGMLFPIYLYLSLYNFYKQSRWLTLFKFILITLTYLLFISLSFLIASLLAIFN